MPHFRKLDRSKLLLLSGLLPFAFPAAAIEEVALDIGSLSAQGWKLENVRLALEGIPNSRQQLALTIGKLALPKPFDDLQLADIRCTAFKWNDRQTVCEQGRARIGSKRWRSPKAAFSFRLGEKSSSAAVTGLRLSGGILNAEMTERAMRWQVRLAGEKLDGELLRKLFGFSPVEIKNGELDFELLASGIKGKIGDIALSVRLHDLSLQTPDGKAATEALSANAKIHASHEGERWHWQISPQLTGGALYLEPVYLEAGKEEIGRAHV